MTTNLTATAPSKIEPGATYSLAGFIAASGISYSRIRRAARAGVDIPTFAIGRRKFIKGSNAVEYLDQLAEQTEQANASESGFQWPGSHLIATALRLAAHQRTVRSDQMLARGTIVGKHELRDPRAPHPEALRDIPQYRSSRGQWKFDFLSHDNVGTARPRANKCDREEFLIQAEMSEARPIDADQLAGLRDHWASDIVDLADECREEADELINLGMELAERADSLEQWAEEVEGPYLDWVEFEFSGDGFTWDEYAGVVLDEMAEGCPE